MREKTVNGSADAYDSGIGIAEDQLDRIFERFYVVDKSRTRKTSSTGLGLSIVHSIIKEHNGTITCETDSQPGTCFVISLPLSSIEKT